MATDEVAERTDFASPADRIIGQQVKAAAREAEDEARCLRFELDVLPVEVARRAADSDGQAAGSNHQERTTRKLGAFKRIGGAQPEEREYPGRNEKAHARWNRERQEQIKDGERSLAPG